jgi:hypothetical protein
MKLYAELAPRRTGQVAGDLLLVLWVLVWSWAGSEVNDGVSALGGVGAQVEDGGRSLAGHLGDAGEAASEVPLVGGQLRAPFDRAGGAAQAIADAGRSQQEVAQQLGLLLGLAVALVPITLVAVLWLPRRIGFARRAGAARDYIAAGGDLDLFALRAITGQPVCRLAAVSDDPLADWRRGDGEVVRRLADLELRDLGLRVPGGPRD